jgi:REP element-mobilizing transposase RayT
MKPTDENGRLSWTPQCYDPHEDRAVVWRKLPHWSQPGTLCFITWRTWDSMPAAVVCQWHAERADWLRHHGVDPTHPNWEALVRERPVARQREFRGFVSQRWNDHLDELHGACVLGRPNCAAVVADSLRHFDQERYYLSDFVVMPNHTHALVAFPSEEAMLAQCESWKRYTAVRINRLLGRKGRFREQDAFEHLVRSPEEFERLRRYIEENPISARLLPNQYIHYRRG